MVPVLGGVRHALDREPPGNSRATNRRHRSFRQCIDRDLAHATSASALEKTPEWTVSGQAGKVALPIVDRSSPLLPPPVDPAAAVIQPVTDNVLAFIMQEHAQTAVPPAGDQPARHRRDGPGSARPLGQHEVNMKRGVGAVTGSQCFHLADRSPCL